MPKYEVEIDGHSVEVHKFRATIEIEAESEVDAEAKATQMAQDDKVEWVERDDGHDPDEEMPVEVDGVEVSEIEASSSTPIVPDSSDKEQLADWEHDEQLRNQESEEEQDEYLDKT
jgi:hypothetical protein